MVISTDYNSVIQNIINLIEPEITSGMTLADTVQFIANELVNIQNNLIPKITINDIINGIEKITDAIVVWWVVQDKIFSFDFSNWGEINDLGKISDRVQLSNFYTDNYKEFSPIKSQSFSAQDLVDASAYLAKNTAKLLTDLVQILRVVLFKQTSMQNVLALTSTVLDNIGELMTAVYATKQDWTFQTFYTTSSGGPDYIILSPVNIFYEAKRTFGYRSDQIDSLLEKAWTGNYEQVPGTDHGGIGVFSVWNLCLYNVWSTWPPLIKINI